MGSESVVTRETRSDSRSSNRLTSDIALPSLGERYQLLRPLGKGGAGIVYRAWDRELARPVAIKVVRPDRMAAQGEGARDFEARLRRESRALAALSHPNVVAVYDVVVRDPHVGIVMELVEGSSLRAWSARGGRSRTDVIRVFLDAAEGLAAAHEVGLVHRDFKPANVIVGSDGRARVLDFGLARSATGWSSSEASPPSFWSDSEAGDLTETGMLVGTPAYMAPEQIDGAPIDARCDQFAYCVSLFEALWGTRPFSSKSLSKRRREMQAGVKFPAGAGPRALRMLVARGLRVALDDRYPSMRELLADLEPLATRRPVRRYWIVGAGILACVAGASFLEEAPSGSRCDAPPAASWSAERQSSIQDAFAATQLPLATQSWERTALALDDYVGRWQRGYDLYCMTEEPDVDRDAVACLARVRLRFDALMTVFEAADRTVVEHALPAIRRLPDPTECGSRAMRRSTDFSPARARIVALQDAGHYERALTAARDMLADARRQGQSDQASAALLEAGRARNEMGAYEEALSDLSEAYFIAIREDDHETAALAAIAAVGVAGKGLRRRQEGMQWVRHARAAISRIDGAQEYEAMLATAEATTLIAAGERDAALPKLEQARAILEEEVGEDDPSTINVINSIGVVYQEQGRFDEALANHRRARDAWEASLGPNHPHVASAEQSIANTLALMGRHTEAIEGYRRVLDAWSATLPPSHPDVAMTHYNIGRLHQLDGRNEEALEEYLLAIELLEPTLGPDHTNTGMPIHNVGALYHEMGDLDAAQRYLEHSLAIFESNGVDPLYVAVNRFELAKVLHERDRDPNRVAQLIVAARDVLAGAGAFGAREHEALVEWVAKNRPDLVAAP